MSGAALPRPRTQLATRYAAAAANRRRSRNGSAWRGGAAWIGVSLAGLLLVAILGGLGARRLGVGVRAAVSDAGPLSPAARALLQASLPWIPSACGPRFSSESSTS